MIDYNKFRGTRRGMALQICKFFVILTLIFIPNTIKSAADQISKIIDELR